MFMDLKLGLCGELSDHNVKCLFRGMKLTIFKYNSMYLQIDVAYSKSSENITYFKISVNLRLPWFENTNIGEK